MMAAADEHHVASDAHAEPTLGAMDYALGLLVTAVVVCALIEVLSRYVLRYSLFFSEEISRFLFIWIVFLGGSIGVKRASHFKLDVLIRLLGTGSERWFELVRDLAIALFSVCLLLGGIRVVRLSLMTMAPTTNLPMGYVYMIVPASAGLSLYYAARQLLGTLGHFRERRGAR